MNLQAKRIDYLTKYHIWNFYDIEIVLRCDLKWPILGSPKTPYVINL